MRCSCTLWASPRHTQRWARGWDYSQEKLLHVLTACRAESASNLRVCFIHRTGKETSPLPPNSQDRLQSYSQQLSLSAEQAGPAQGSRAALAEGKISSHLSHTSVCSQHNSPQEWHDWPKWQILHQLKLGGAFAPTRTSGFHRRSWGRNSSVMKQKP